MQKWSATRSVRNKTMMMRFIIEQRPITDTSGRPAAHDPEAALFHHCEAESAEKAVHQFAAENASDIIGTVVKFPGLQAVATIRNLTGVYTLQVTPSSQGMVPLRD
jgi:hypothetical protein